MLTRKIIFSQQLRKSLPHHWLTNLSRSPQIHNNISSSLFGILTQRTFPCILCIYQTLYILYNTHSTWYLPSCKLPKTNKLVWKGILWMVSSWLLTIGFLIRCNFQRKSHQISASWTLCRMIKVRGALAIQVKVI